MIRNVPADQIPKLTAAISMLRHPYRLALSLMLDAGLRLEETRKLTWCDLVWQEQYKTALELTTDMTKYRRARTIPINRNLAAAVSSAHTELVRKHVHVAAWPALATTERSGPISARMIQRSAQMLGRRTIGRTLTPHMLRHTFATRLLTVSNVSIVQAALGHRRLSTTQIYMHPSQTELEQAVLLA